MKLFKNKKALRDVIFIASLLLISLLLFVFLHSNEAGAGVVVKVEGVEIARYSLSRDGSFSLNGGTNILVIENGEARLSDADCPDLLCVKQGSIKYTGECITCLPNKLTVTVFGAEDDGLDAAVG